MAEQIDSYWEVLKPCFEAVDIYNGPENYDAAIAALPRPVVLLYATHMFLAEVHNGGFLQFFWNNTGMVAPESVEGFRAMGMPAMASLLEKAASKLGQPYPRDRDERWDALLVESGRSTRDLKRIFRKQNHRYLAFVEATEPLGYDSLNNKSGNSLTQRMVASKRRLPAMRGVSLQASEIHKSRRIADESNLFQV
jgi:hypothetical protein